MTKAMDPLREEHREIFPEIQVLRTVADTAQETPFHELKALTDRSLRFLQGTLVPHAEAEDAVLYPVVAARLGGPKATATMSRDHVEVGRLIAELRQVRAAMDANIVAPEQLKGLRRDLARVLYSLYAVVALHFAKEEEIYVPLLDESLSLDEASALFEKMEQAASTVRGRAAA